MIAERFVARADDGSILIAAVDDSASPARYANVDALAAQVASAPQSTRWIWNDTTRWYPALLARGVRVTRCRDLRLTHTILRHSAHVPASADVKAPSAWDAAASAPTPDALFDVDDGTALPESLEQIRAEFARQEAAVNESTHRDALRLLLAGESLGALVAAEMHAAGLPWDARIHDEILTRTLGERAPTTGVPAGIARAAAATRAALGDPHASLDSQPQLLRALHRAGVLVSSTNKWELARIEHPVIAPLLEYKKLTRLLSANGWAWMQEWAPAGRFRPVYVPGGVVTGRWASSGGGALQLPRQLRPAVHADPGWVLIVADVAQLEPRVLAAMSGDAALADAARGTDLYQGMADEGVVPTRQDAKIAMLGAMYGATTGDSGRLVPALRRAYPRAMRMVDEAANVGEQGGVTSTLLGRSHPRPSESWQQTQGRAADPDASETERARARSSARDRGRFTRNFIVQGTAAEWALVWLGEIRARLAALDGSAAQPAEPSGPAFRTQAHLAFFLHDEVIVHAPREQADAAASAVRDAAVAAGRTLFGDFPLDFPLDLRISSDAAKD